MRSDPQRWPVAEYRIKAYFMHEHEQSAAHNAEEAKIIKDAVWTDGYVIGVVKQHNFKKLS